MTQETQKKRNKEWSTLDKIVGLSSVGLAIDGIVVPFLTGKTLHDWLGLPPAGDYKIFGEKTVKMAEGALWGLSQFYLVGKGLLYGEIKQ